MRGSRARWMLLPVAACVLCLLPACELLGDSGSSGATAVSTSGSATVVAPELETSDPGVERRAGIYEAVIRQLVEKDHTYGGRFPGFKAVYIVDGVVRGAGSAMHSWRREPRYRFDDALKLALEERLSGFPSVTFVPRRARPSIPPVRASGNRRALVVLGPVVGGEQRVEVSAHLAINGYPTIWLTYVVRERANGWKVTGTTGSIAIT